ncbi:MAG: oligosaccharide flippase family protein [Marinilabiliaceae bacterium]|nr:oligosaccharide flippase family protein [Marinilabiliaceae bacterium]
MSKIKSLAGDTIIYGASTILGRLLNWLLMPFYTHLLPMEEFGVVSNLYAYISYFLILLTFGFETGFFRFANKRNSNVVLKTLGATITSWSFLFVVLFWVFKSQIQSFLGEDLITEDFIFYTVIIVALDALISIPFADLRFRRKSKTYAGLRFLQVVITVFFNVFFLVICPWLISNGIDIPEFIFSEDNKVKYVFISNLISSGTIAFILSPLLLKGGFIFDKSILKDTIRYSYPIVIVGLFGMVIQNIEKILMPYLLDDGMKQLAIYSANFKIGVLMALFIQSYRLAFEPFFFKEGKDQASKQLYGKILKYFVIFGMVIFVGILQFMDIINMIFPIQYEEGNMIIPYVLLGQLMFGVYYSLSLWYKLTDKTYFGAFISGFGALLVLIGNILTVPKFGYIGAAISSLVAFTLMAVSSYIIGQKYYFIPYPVSNIIKHICIGIVVVIVSKYFIEGDNVFHIVLKGTIFVCYLGILYFLERKEFKTLI